MKNDRLQSAGADEILLNALESMPDGFCTIDKNWKFTYINRALAKIIGENQGDLIGKNLWTSFPEAIHSKFYDWYHHALEKQKSVTVEDFYAPLNVWLEVNVHPMKQGLSFFVKDVSARKKQEERLRFISKAASEVIWEYNFSTNEFEFDAEKVETIFGYKLESSRLPLSFWLDKVPKEDLKAGFSNREYAIIHNFNFYLTEFRLRKADGNQAYVRNRVYITRNQEGQPVSLVGAMEDVTMKKLSEKALMESMESYHRLFNSSPLATVIFDPASLRIFDYNSAMLEQYGFNREDLAKMSVLDMHPAEYHQKVAESVNILKPNVRNDLGLMEHVKKNGQRILVEVSATRICYRNKDAVLATANDVTEKVRLQKQVVREKVNYQKGITKATLEAQEKERTEIAKELHDNINQVLAAAKLNIENIVHCPEHSRHFVHKGSGLLQTAIDEIRRLSRTLTAPTLRGLTFYDALVELLEPYKDLGLFKMDYRFDFDEAVLEEGLYLSAYRILQEQLNNTIKYAKATSVNITLRTTKNSFELAFEDDGIGFDPVTVRKGLGLINLQNRVDAYNGKLSLVTSRGKGYCAYISFPIQN